MIENEVIKLYDADILAVELATIIGIAHSEQLRRAIKKANEPTIEIASPDNWDLEYPYIYQD